MDMENIDNQEVIISDEMPWCTTIQVHISDPVTGEYRGTRDEHVVPGTGLPPECHEDAPPEVSAGHAAVRCDDTWQILPDWRGVPLWSTSTGDPVQIEIIGVTPTDVGATDIERTDPTTTWNGQGWAPDPVLIEQLQIDQRTEQNATIKTRLAELDSRSIRVVHEALLELVAAGATLSPETLGRLQGIEEQKAELRAQLL